MSTGDEWSLEVSDQTPWPEDCGQLQKGRGSTCVIVLAYVFLEGFHQILKVFCDLEKAQNQSRKREEEKAGSVHLLLSQPLSTTCGGPAVHQAPCWALGIQW